MRFPVRNNLIFLALILALFRGIYWIWKADLVHAQIRGDFFHLHLSHQRKNDHDTHFHEPQQFSKVNEIQSEKIRQHIDNVTIVQSHWYRDHNAKSKPTTSIVRSPAIKAPSSSLSLAARKQGQERLLGSLKRSLVVTASKSTPPPLNISLDPFPYQKTKLPQDWPKSGWVAYKGFVFRNTVTVGYGHMATVALLPVGSPFRLMAAWQAATKVEGTDGQHIRASFSDNAQDWSEPLVIPIGHGKLGQAVWSPVLFTQEDFIYLFFSESTICKNKASSRRPARWAPGGDIRVTKSRDGVTWTQPVTIYSQTAENGIPKVIANQPEVTSSGAWVLPFWRERPKRQACHTSSKSSAGVLVSSDSGTSWAPHNQLRSPGTWLIEGSVAETPDHRLMQLFRTSRGKIFQALSTNDGKSWGEVTSVGLPNPNSKINLLRLSTGELALCYNGSPRNRNKLWVAISPDAKQWFRIAELEPGRAGLNFGYPTMTQDGDKLVVTYSIMRRSGRLPITMTGIRVAVVQLPKPHHALKLSPQLSSSLQSKGVKESENMVFLTEDGKVDEDMLDAEAGPNEEEEEEDSDATLDEDSDREDAEAEEEAEEEEGEDVVGPLEEGGDEGGFFSDVKLFMYNLFSPAKIMKKSTWPGEPENQSEEEEMAMLEAASREKEVEEVESLGQLMEEEEQAKVHHKHCWDAGDGVLAQLRNTRSHQLNVQTSWISKNNAKLGYQHMAMVSGLPSASPSPARWLAVWQAGERFEGSQDQHLSCATSVDALKWNRNCTLPFHANLPPFSNTEGIRMRAGVKKQWRQAIWSPVLFLDPVTDQLWLFYSESTKCLQYTEKRGTRLRLARWGPGGDVKYITSKDGVTWTPPVTILQQSTDGAPKVVANQLEVVQDANGGLSWVLPYWSEPADPSHEGPCTSGSSSKPPVGKAGVLITSDRGATWTTKGSLRSSGTWLIEGSVAKRSDGSLLQYFRSQKGLIFAASSTDGGNSWSNPQPTHMPNPNSKLNLIALNSGDLALAFNDYSSYTITPKAINKGRKRLRVAMSCDDGGSWVNVAELETGHFKFYFHYPTIVQDNDRLLIIYSTMLAGRFQHSEIGGGIKIAVVKLPSNKTA